MGESVETIVGTHSSAEPQHVSFQSSQRIELESSVQDMEARTSLSCGDQYHPLQGLVLTLALACPCVCSYTCTRRRRGDLL